MSSQPATKKARTEASNDSSIYELLYHPTIPGRGEFARLILEATSTPYVDVGNDDASGGYKRVQDICISQSSLESADGQPPVFAPPALRISSEAGEGASSALLISQTPNILAFLGERLGFDGGEAGKWHVSQVALTALDLNNEIHDTHHPLAVAKYYEEQKEAALEKATDVRTNRFPKYLGFFQRVLKHNDKASGQSGFLVGGELTYADTTVWQVLDGMMFAFPKEMEVRRKEFPDLLEGFYERVKGHDKLKGYLASERRMPYSHGVFRYYPELDRQ